MHIKKLLTGIVILLIIIGGGYISLSKTDTGSIIANMQNILNIESSVNEKELDNHDVEVIRVVDGDTIIVRNNKDVEETVRLLLIDTPESVHPTEPEQLFGQESSDYAKDMIKEGDIVRMEVGNPERDKYDRILAYIWIDDVNFNQLMIEKGFARVAYVYEPNTKYLNDFKQAEQNAKTQKENIWSIDGYVTDNGFDMSVIQ